MGKLRCVGVVVLCTILFCATAHADTGPLVDLLYKRNLHKVRPVLNETTVVEVKIEVVPRRILDVSEIQQQLKVHVWLRVKWTDEFFRWNPVDHNGTTQIFVNSAYIWKPDLVLYQSNGYEMAIPASQSIPITVDYDGSAKLLVPQIYTTHCKMNLTYYPFDSQVCHMRFSAWAEGGELINISPGTDQPESSSYRFNGEWELGDLTIERHVVYYSCCPHPYPDVEFTLFLTRRPWFYVMNLIVPFVALTFLSIFVFFIPPESGEKVSLAVTTLLSLVVFTQLVMTTVPAASDGTSPIVGVYFVGSVIAVSVVVVLAVLALHAYHMKDSGKPVPGLIRFIVLTCMGTFCCKIGCLNIDMKRGREQGDARKDTGNGSLPKRRKRFGSRIYNVNSSEMKQQDDSGLFYLNSAFQVPDQQAMDLGRVTSGDENLSSTVGSHTFDRKETQPQALPRRERGASWDKEPVESEDISSLEWVTVSRVLDRFFLIVFAALYFFMPLIGAWQCSGFRI